MSSKAKAVGMGLLFYPRGGSAHVVRSLDRALGAAGWDVTIACGSLGRPGSLGHAGTFFAGADLTVGAYDDAVERWQRGLDPMDAPFPMHPSFEARAGTPDRAFPFVSPAQGDRLAASWADVLASSRRLRRARVLHLNHITPLHDAAAATFPKTPVISHLHGTELKLLAAIDRGEPGLGDGPYAAYWATRMGLAARGARATVAISPHVRDEAERLLGVDPATVHCIANGVDAEWFSERHLEPDERRANWQRWLARDPRGWDEGTAEPGSVRYSDREVLDAFVDSATGELRPVLIYTGRFLSFKRVPLLIRAYARARERMSTPAPLVVWGGVPGEWEGEHPHSVVVREGIRGVFFAGWRGHDDLPLALNSADCFVAPSTDEPFGLVYLEAMACGLPVIGTLSGGPPSFVNVVPGEPDGWLVPPDDEAALAEAMVRAVNDAAERRRRGQNAVRHVRREYAWSSIAGRFADLYQSVAGITSRATR